MLQKTAVNRYTLELIEHLQSKDYLSDFLLVGGTSLALQIGHRISVDIDLFIAKDFNTDSLLEKLETDFNFQMDFREHNTLKGTIKEIKVDFLSHKYSWIRPKILTGNIKMASTEDIIAMKLNAISMDGTRNKDFIDIYFLLDSYSVGQMLSFYKEKYSSRNSMHVLKSLNYFDDVSLEYWPLMIKQKDLSWTKVKARINATVLEYVKRLKR